MARLWEGSCSTEVRVSGRIAVVWNVVIGIVAALSPLVWGFGAVYAVFVVRRRATRSETASLATAVKNLWQGRGDPDEVRDSFTRLSGNDDIRLVAQDRIRELFDKNPWHFFDRAKQVLKPTFAGDRRAVLKPLAKDIQDELNHVLEKRLTLGLKPFLDWMWKRPRIMEFEEEQHKDKPG